MEAKPVWTAELSGDIDISNADRIVETIDEAVANGALLCVLKLDDVTFLDSSGLRALAHAQTTMDQRGGRLVIDGMSAAARRVLELSGMLESLSARHDDDTADVAAEEEVEDDAEDGGERAASQSA